MAAQDDEKNGGKPFVLFGSVCGAGPSVFAHPIGAVFFSPPPPPSTKQQMFGPNMKKKEWLCSSGTVDLRYCKLNY